MSSGESPWSLDAIEGQLRSRGVPPTVKVTRVANVDGTFTDYVLRSDFDAAAALLSRISDLAEHKGPVTELPAAVQNAFSQCHRAGQSLARRHAADDIARLTEDRDHWKAECEKARRRETEMLHDAEIAAVSLPEADATSPDHLRFAAHLLVLLGAESEDHQFRGTPADHVPFSARQVREEATRAETPANDFVGAAARVIWGSRLVASTTDAETAAHALHSAGLLRDGDGA